MYICFWVFSSRWKKKRGVKNEKKKLVQTLKWATAHLSIRLGVWCRGVGRVWRGAGRAGWAPGRRRTCGTTQTSRRAGHAGHDAGRVGARHGGAQVPGTARGTAHRGAREALRHGRLGSHDTATASAWACLCAPGCAAGPTCCALGAPSLFLDSVLFLNHFFGYCS